MKRRSKKRYLKEKDVGRKLRRRTVDSEPTAPDRPILIFDGTALAYNAWHTTGSLSYRGENTGVIYGFMRKVFRFAYQFKTPNLVFCWDAGLTYRHLNYPDYKISREKRKQEYDEFEKQEFDDLLIQRMALNHDILPAMGFKNSFCFLYYEGDDVIAQIVKQKFKGKKKIIVTSDNDMFQLLDKADILKLNGSLFTEKDFQEKYGIYPHNWPLAKAIGGCDGDDIKGIEGVGDAKKPSSKALKYIKNELGPGKVLDRITSIDGKSIIERNLPLVTLPFMPDLMPKITLRKDRVTRKKLIKQFDRFHFLSMLEKENFEKWEKIFNL